MPQAGMCFNLPIAFHSVERLYLAQSRPTYQSVVLPFDSLIYLVRFGRSPVLSLYIRNRLLIDHGR
jgi:hypothetical protein